MSNEHADHIFYRFVVNDALCHPWEPMPEAGRTLQDLVEFLKTCKNRDLLGDPWDYRRLTLGGAWDNHIISYGLRSQFWLPVIPKVNEFVWLNENHDLSVVCCGETLSPEDEYDATPVCPDEGFIIRCPECGKNTRRANGKVQRTPQDAYDKWIEWFEHT